MDWLPSSSFCFFFLNFLGLVTDISIYEDKLFLASDNKSESSIVEIRLDDAA